MKVIRVAGSSITAGGIGGAVGVGVIVGLLSGLLGVGGGIIMVPFINLQFGVLRT